MALDPAARRLIEAIHARPAQCALALTGGGAQAAGWLLSVPGGSRTVVEVVVPYHERALVEYLGHRPEQFCSASTTREIADRAYERARWLTSGQRPAPTLIGIGCTASLASDRPKRGDHRFHVSARTADRTDTYSLVLNKGARSRETEETVLDAVLLNALAAAAGIEARLDPGLLAGEAIQVESVPTGDPVAAFLRGEHPVLCVHIDGRLDPAAPRPAALLPGAFNPLHEGHCGLAEAAFRLTGLPVAFELSVTNVDKPPLTPEEVRRRLAQFSWRVPLWLTRAPTFAAKALLFPGAVFVVGADTAERIVAPRYYDGSETRMTAALEQIRTQGCRFLVAARADPAGTFQSLRDLDLPASCKDLFSEIPETAFRLNVSSTELRQKM